MARYLNKATICGNLGRDPDFASFPDGSEKVSMSLATTKSWKDKATGEQKQRTQWHRIVITNKPLIDILRRTNAQKGDKIYIEGELEYRTYTTKEGNEKDIAEVVVRPYQGELMVLTEVKPEGYVDSDSNTASVQEPVDIDDAIPF